MKACEGGGLWLHAFTTAALYGGEDCQLHAPANLVWRKEPRQCPLVDFYLYLPDSSVITLDLNEDKMSNFHFVISFNIQL
jgi:hypothetical protein